MYINFYLLKNVYFPDNLPGSFSTICLSSCAPLGSVSYFHKPEVKLRRHVEPEGQLCTLGYF